MVINEHDHSHSSHDYSPQTIQTDSLAPEKVYAYLKHMLDHNREHATDLKDFAQKMDSDDMRSILNEAIESYEKGNALIQEIVSRIHPN